MQAEQKPVLPPELAACPPAALQVGQALALALPSLLQRPQGSPAVTVCKPARLPPASQAYVAASIRAHILSCAERLGLQTELVQALLPPEAPLQPADVSGGAMQPSAFAVAALPQPAAPPVLAIQFYHVCQ